MRTSRDMPEDQDRAAGGVTARTLVLEGGVRATASIAIFKAKHGYQSYAYLRFKSSGINTKIYVGNVTAETREEALKIGWTLAKKKKVVEAHGWHWERARRD